LSVAGSSPVLERAPVVGDGPASSPFAKWTSPAVQGGVGRVAAVAASKSANARRFVRYGDAAAGDERSGIAGSNRSASVKWHGLVGVAEVVARRPR